MAAIGPGSVLGGRYRIDVLLSEVDGAKFWLGIDTALSRKVAIHSVPNDDERAPLLVEAARASASVVQANLLRVLDCTVEDAVTWVVNEWGEGSTLHDLIGSGPLPFERAAWLALEVATAVADAHRAGIAHGRLNPESVLVTRTGEVKIIGFVINKALRPRIPTHVRYGSLKPFEADVIDLASILYSALTARWCGYSPSMIAAPPLDSHGPIRPRQVCAGVPRDLDALCVRVLREEGVDHAMPIDSAHEIWAALTDFVGDPTRWAPQSIADMQHSPKEVTLPHPRPSDSWLHAGLLPAFDAIRTPDGPAPAPEIPDEELVPTAPPEGLLRPSAEDSEDSESTGDVVPGSDRWLFGDTPDRRPTHRAVDHSAVPAHPQRRRNIQRILLALALVLAMAGAFVLGLRG